MDVRADLANWLRHARESYGGDLPVRAPGLLSVANMTLVLSSPDRWAACPPLLMTAKRVRLLGSSSIASKRMFTS